MARWPGSCVRPVDHVNGSTRSSPDTSQLSTPGLPATNLTLGPIPANGQGVAVLNDVLHLDVGVGNDCQDTRLSVPIMFDGRNKKPCRR